MSFELMEYKMVLSLKLQV